MPRVAKRQRVHGAGRTGTLAEVINKAEHGAFVGNRDIQPFAARALKLAHRFLEFLGRHA